ncbi:hypothetical protein ACIPUC_14820 [Streptomyces sp. LARHCF249]
MQKAREARGETEATVHELPTKRKTAKRTTKKKTTGAAEGRTPRRRA